MAVHVVWVRIPPGMLLLLACLWLSSCGESQAERASEPPVPWVKTVRVELSDASVLGLSGVVRARAESPLSFQVAGRVTARKVDAGQQVQAGQLLFELDKRDLQQSLNMAKATLEAADLALASTQADLLRHEQLRARNFISSQALDGARVTVREAQTRREVALAHLDQTRNALTYATLRAPANGVLVEVLGEVGQVLGAGQTVAVLAQSGAREVEVNFPEQVSPPARGEVVLEGGNVSLSLREQAGAVDSQARTLRARYSLPDSASGWLLGRVVRTRFTTADAVDQVFRVPLAALNERGAGPCVWRLLDGRVSAVPVTVLALDSEQARVRGPLRQGEHIVALGTHLLTDHMSVRELNP